MNEKDKIAKLAWDVVQSSKDVTFSNLLKASSDGTLKLEKSQLDKLMMIVGTSIDAGYHNASKTFNKSVDSCLSNLVESVTNESVKSSKKKG
jgi:hypothetical protein